MPEAGYKLRITVEGEPRSKARPRFSGNGGVYSEAGQKNHEELLEWHLRAAMGHRRPWEQGVEVGLVFYRSNRQRIDLDNLVKAVFDAATGIVWVDDVQVVNFGARLELDRELPRTEIFVGRCVTSMPRGSEAVESRICPTCGKQFPSHTYDSKPGGQVYCSKACVGTKPKDCPVCGTTFKPRRIQQNYCGKPCAAKSKETKRKIAAKRRRAELPSCLLCDQGLHRKGAILCRSCWLKEAPKGKTKAEIIASLEASGHVQRRGHR